ncbi:MAG: PAS domain-containing sensor histidine kinase [Chitinophagaceae bacterium]
MPVTSEPIKIDQESFRLLVESVSDYAIFMIDITGHIISWNKGVEQLKGYTASEIVGKHISVFYTADEVKNGEPEMNLKMARQLGQFEYEGWRVRKDGSVFWANEVFTSLKDDNGKLVGYGKVTRDMTSKKHANEEIKHLNIELKSQLQKSESETLDYKHALDESSIVAITDQKGIIKHINENFCKISKYRCDELIGKDHRIINSGYHSKEFIRELWMTIANGMIWRGEIKNRAKDGSIYWVDTTIVPFLNENGKPYQYLAIRSDISQRKLAEEDILNINKDLEKRINERTFELTEALEREKELNEMKSRFVSMASHEFRTPLTTILSSISLIEHYKTQDQELKRQKHVERIMSSVSNLTDLLDDYLSLDKLEQGRVEIKILNFDLHPFIEEIIGQMDGMLKKKDQKISFRINGPANIQQDKKIVRNVLLNLLSNAVKYSPVKKEIAVLVTVKKGLVSISVEDEGIGIPQACQKDIFNKFFRANNAINIQGTGLGLNIVTKYVQLLGGTIHFISVENKGSTFTVEFPQIW